MTSGTLAELECRVHAGVARFLVIYWRGGEDGDDERITREFPTVREATRFMATIATNKARAWIRIDRG